MMAGIKEWIMRVIVLSILCAAADSLMPEGAVRRVGKLVCTMALLCGILRPVSTLKGVDFTQYLREYSAMVEETRLELEQKTAVIQKTVIEEQCAAYIADKAAQLGVVCRVEVECEPTREGIWLPARVTLTGRFSDVEQSRMTQFLQRQFGVEVEGQSYFITGEAEP